VEGVKQMLWLRELLQDLGHAQDGPTMVKCDNTAVLSLASDLAISEKRSRYLIVKVKFLQEQESNGTALYSYVPSAENPADILTKIQSSPALVRTHSDSLMHGYGVVL
jgi:hypothetical protein